MISLQDLLNGETRTNDELTKKYYQLMKDKLVDFLENVVIDITLTGKQTQVRWIILKDEYDNFKSVINWMVSLMLDETKDANKMN